MDFVFCLSLIMVFFYINVQVLDFLFKTNFLNISKFTFCPHLKIINPIKSKLSAIFYYSFALAYLNVYFKISNLNKLYKFNKKDITFHINRQKFYKK